MKINFEKMGGLIPAIAQDEKSGTVLMLGFMNPEAFEKTKETGFMTFFSRSRQRLWTKGETSGHVLEVVSWATDCDQDTLLFKVKSQGPTCHTGSTSCFPDMRVPIGFLSELEGVIAQRKLEKDTTSYTAQLFKAGPQRIAQKIGEEGVETALALVSGAKEEFLSETADLLYHVLVGLSAKGLSLADVADCLQQRHTKALIGVQPSGQDAPFALET